MLKDEFKKNIVFVKNVAEFLIRQNTNPAFVSISMLQRKFQIGYSKASSVLDGFERLGIFYIEQKKNYMRKVDQEKLTQFIEFLNQVV